MCCGSNVLSASICCNPIVHLHRVMFFFFSSAPFWPHEGPLVQSCFYWAASRHRLFSYRPISRCARSREGIIPDLPLPGWQATGWHGRGGVGKEVAEGWNISVQVVVGREVFKQQAGSEGRCCGVGEQSGPPGHQSRTGGCLGWLLMFEVPLANMFATFRTFHVNKQCTQGWF